MFSEDPVRRSNGKKEQSCKTLDIIVDMLTAQANNIRRLQNKVNKLMSDMNDNTEEIIEGVGDKVEEICGGRHLEKGSKEGKQSNRTIEAYKRRMMSDLVLLPEHFNKDSFASCISKVVFREVLFKFVKGDQFNVEGLDNLLRVLFFSLKPSESKDTTMKRTFAKEGFRFKKSIVLQCLKHGQENVLSLYEDSGKKSSRPSRPFWLSKKPSTKGRESTEKYAITEKEMQVGFDRHENGNAAAFVGSRRMQIGCNSVEPQKNDHGEFISYYAFSELTKLLNGQRRSAVHSFGELLGYVFVDWGNE